MYYCEEFFSNVSRNKNAHLVAVLVYFNLHIHNQFHIQAFSSIGNLIAYVVALFLTGVRSCLKKQVLSKCMELVLCFSATFRRFYKFPQKLLPFFKKMVPVETNRLLFYVSARVGSLFSFYLTFYGLRKFH